MNWLAHVFLSEHNVDFQLGNFLADPLKGKLWNGAGADLQKGLQTHMRIDAYTDTHAAVSDSKARLRKKGLLKPVVIDLTYDYLLTKNWDAFSSLPFDDFLNTFYAQAKKRAPELPARAADLVANLVEQDRLGKYRELRQLEQAFERIDARLSTKLRARESAASYFETVCEKIDALESDFLLFFPELCRHVRLELNAHRLTHWRI